MLSHYWLLCYIYDPTLLSMKWPLLCLSIPSIYCSQTIFFCSCSCYLLLCPLTMTLSPPPPPPSPPPSVSIGLFHCLFTSPLSMQHYSFSYGNELFCLRSASISHSSSRPAITAFPLPPLPFCILQGTSDAQCAVWDYGNP